ncbi:MAG: gliding motility protein GldN, partial [Muribaculaceae bacterium]|nr:gliding motility protein GldN [Muribaculaceae bacterium]
TAFARYTLAAVALFAAISPGAAQTNDGGSSSSSIVRRGGGDRSRGKQQEAGPGVTERMQQRFTTQETSDADKMWMRVIYRDLKLDNPKNTPLYYPEEVVDGQENLFRIIMRLVADNRIPVYEYLDGKEIFTDQYKVKVSDMLDRFHVLYSPAKGSSEKNPKFLIEEADVPANEVLSYFVLEKWEFDSRTNKTRRIVEAICPVLHRSDDFGGEAVRYPMFWVNMDNLRPYLTQQYIFVDDDNNLPKYTYADYFSRNMYDGDIYKTRNLANKSMMQLYPDPDDRQRAQDSIQNRLEQFDKKLWVPSREEVIAAREAREAAEEAAEAAKDADAAIASRDGEVEEAEEAPRKEVRATRASRARGKSTATKTKPKKKASKPKSAP